MFNSRAKHNKADSGIAKKVFRWDIGLVTNIIDCLLEYKSSMEYRGLDFDGDNARQNCTEETSASFFGRATPVSLPENFDNVSTEEKCEAEKVAKKKQKSI